MQDSHEIGSEHGLESTIHEETQPILVDLEAKIEEETCKKDSRNTGNCEQECGKPQSKIPPWLLKRNKRKAAVAAISTQNDTQAKPASHSEHGEGPEEACEKNDEGNDTTAITTDAAEDDPQIMQSKNDRTLSTEESQTCSTDSLSDEVKPDVGACEEGKDLAIAQNDFPSPEIVSQGTGDDPGKETEKSKTETMDTQPIKLITSDTNPSKDFVVQLALDTKKSESEEQTAVAQKINSETGNLETGSSESSKPSETVEPATDSETQAKQVEHVSEDTGNRTDIGRAEVKNKSAKPDAAINLDCDNISNNTGSDDNSQTKTELNCTNPVCSLQQIDIPQPKMTYKSDPVKYTYNEQNTTEAQNCDGVNCSKEEKPDSEESAQQTNTHDFSSEHQDTDQKLEQIQTELHQPQTELHQPVEPSIHVQAVDCRMQMIMAATLAQLPPDMTVWDLYQYINPNILDSINLPTTPVVDIEEATALYIQDPEPNDDDSHPPAKYEEVIARRAEAKMRIEREVPPLLEAAHDEHGRRPRPRRGLRGHMRGRRHYREYDPAIGSYVPVQRMNTNYTAGEDEFIGPQLPAYLQHLAHANEELNHHGHHSSQPFDFIENEDAIDDDTEEYAGYEEGEVVDGDHWAHPDNRSKPKRRSYSPQKRFSGHHGGSDPLGFDEGDRISNNIGDFHRRLMRMSGSVQDQDHDHMPAYSTGIQYRQGDPIQQQDEISQDRPPVPEQHDTSTEMKKNSNPESAMQFARPKYHEEGYSERFHAAPTGKLYFWGPEVNIRMLFSNNSHLTTNILTFK